MIKNQRTAVDGFSFSPPLPFSHACTYSRPHLYAFQYSEQLPYPGPLPLASSLKIVIRIYILPRTQPQQPGAFLQNKPQARATAALSNDHVVWPVNQKPEEEGREGQKSANLNRRRQGREHTNSPGATTYRITTPLITLANRLARRPPHPPAPGVTSASNFRPS